MEKIVNYYLIYKHSPERYCRTIKGINPLTHYNRTPIKFRVKFYHTFIKVQLHLTYIKNATFFIKIK